MSGKLAAALELAKRGLPVFPVKAGAKAPPLLNAWPARATLNENQITSWWSGGLWNENIGVHCAGLIVLDIDVKKGGVESLAALEAIHGLDETFTVTTPSGGRHYYYRGPDVANGVNSLGPGIDVRSRGGYVVGPGSEIPAGQYSVAVDAPLADAPTWLVERLKSAPPPTSKEVKVVADASSELYVSAREWLRTAERSVKGQGGDQAAYRVACRLRDLGVSEAQAAELMRSDAWDHGCGWRGGWLEDKPIRSAYRYAQNDPGVKAVSAADFPAMPEPVSTEKQKRAPKRLKSIATAVSTGAGYVVKGLLLRGSYAILYGAPGEGKTFVGMDLAYHVAAGKPWMDHKVQGGPVLYLPYEGLGGIAKRGAALLAHYGPADVPLFVYGADFNLREPTGRKRLGEILADMGEKPVMIVIDTLARALQGGDENSAQDVGAFNAAIAALVESTGACVLVVHHSGKDKTKGARGSSALLGAVDTELEVDSRQVAATKQRDVEIGAPIGFTLTPVTLGLDEDGDQITSCVVTPGPAAPPPAKLRGNLARAWQVLCKLRPTNHPITLTEWREGCLEWIGTRKATMYDLRVQLQNKGLIEMDDEGLIRRTMK